MHEVLLNVAGYNDAPVVLSVLQPRGVDYNMWQSLTGDVTRNMHLSVGYIGAYAQHMLYTGVCVCHVYLLCT